MMLPLLIFVLHLLSSVSSSDLHSDRAALLALRSAVGGRTLFWNAKLTTPCNWAGVKCQNSRVTVLRLPASSLFGRLPPSTLSNLTLLRTLSLRLNHLSGPLPEDLSRLSQLRHLYLQGNRFSGALSDFLFTLHSLVRLSLASNNFSGEIPSGINSLTRLRTLSLENNQFSGALPDIELPNLEQFNVSFNKLKGLVPRGLHGKPKSAFLGTLLCGKPLDKACAAEAGETLPASAGWLNGGRNLEKNGRTKLSGGAIAGIVVGSVAGWILLLLVLFILRKKWRGKKASSKNQGNETGGKTNVLAENGRKSSGLSVAAAAKSENGTAEREEGASAAAAKDLVFFGNGLRAFDLEELLRASAEVLGKGTLGTSYKAVLEVGTAVTVKRLRDVTVSESEFKEKIGGAGAMDHENLALLRAYYYSTEEKLLVYDYMPMGSLSALLHGNKGTGRTPLNWESRTRVALGAARGVEYLHFQGANVSHGNIKSSNILLSESLNARVSDFGLNYLVGPSSSPTRLTGYRAPEVTDQRYVSQKADVYSFGVLLLELVTGKTPSRALLNEDEVDLPRWVRSAFQEEWTSKAFDPELLHSKNAEEEMVQLLQLGIDCTAQYPDQRPSISVVAKRIEELRLRDNQEQHDYPSEAD